MSCDKVCNIVRHSHGVIILDQVASWDPANKNPHLKKQYSLLFFNTKVLNQIVEYQKKKLRSILLSNQTKGFVPSSRNHPLR